MSVYPYEENVSPRTLSIFQDFSGAVTLDAEFNMPIKGIYIGTAGVAGIVKWINFNGETQTSSCWPGIFYFIRAKKVLSAGTTATDLYWFGGT